MSARLIGRIAGVPWAIHEPALQTILEIAQRQDVSPANLDAWKAHMAPTREAIAFRPSADLPGARLAQLRDGIAVIGIAGPIFRYANLFTRVSGATALADVAMDLQLAREDARVRGILLVLDTPGGEADGVADVADAVRSAAATKPLVAFVDGLAASAGYWIASAASDVVLSRTALVGSLGVVGTFSPPRADAPLEIVSSQTPGKRRSPHTEEGRASWQAVIDRLAEEFLTSAAAFRGVSVDALLAATDGGGMLVGQDAVAAGLADRIGTFEDTLAEMVAGTWTPPRRKRARAEADVPHGSPQGPAAAGPNQEHIGMTDNAPSAAPDATVENPPPVAPPAQAAVEASVPQVPAAADPVAAERARCAAIQVATKSGFAKLAALAVEQGWSAATFSAAQDSSAEAVASAARGAQAQGFGASFPQPIAGGGGSEAGPQTLEEKAKASFASDEKLRAEFGTEARYLAFVKAEAEGKVRVISKRA